MAHERNLTWVHPYGRTKHVIAGQGTIALEMLEDVADIEMLVIPIGGGGLISGIAVAAKAFNPEDRDRRRGAGARPVVLERDPARNFPLGGSTLAEGIAVKNVGRSTLPIVRDLVSEIVLVDEQHIERAVMPPSTPQKTMAERRGRRPVLAAMLAQPRRFAGKKVGLVFVWRVNPLCILASIMVRELERDDRISSFRSTIPDGSCSDRSPPCLASSAPTATPNWTK